MSITPTFLQWQVNHAKSHGDPARALRLMVKSITGSVARLGAAAEIATLSLAALKEQLARQIEYVDPP